MPAQLLKDAERVTAQLDAYLRDDTPLNEAVRHAVMAGGKRLRAHLVYASARLCGIDEERADFGAMAIELMHAYSLVHDDLPCMDDDDLRRGEPTVHVKWDEATAVLVGDLLQTLAFEALIETPFVHETQVLLVRSFAQAAKGMVHGQALDLAAESAVIPLSLDDIILLQNRKTGDLIEWSGTFGATVSGKFSAPLRAYARALGLAFQIWDDVLDIEANSEALGKTAGKDEKAGKATFVSLLGLEQAKLEARKQIQVAKTALDGFSNTKDLLELAEFVITRGN